MHENNIAGRYWISNIVRLPEGRAKHLRATFDLHIAGVGSISACRYLVDGNRRWIKGPSMKDEYRGWFQTVEFDREFATGVLEAFDRAIAEDEAFGEDVSK